MNSAGLTVVLVWMEVQAAKWVEAHQFPSAFGNVSKLAPASQGDKMERVIVALMSYGLSSKTQLLSFAGGEGETKGVIYPLSPRRSRAEPQLRSPVLSYGCAGGSE